MTASGLADLRPVLHSPHGWQRHSIRVQAGPLLSLERCFSLQHVHRSFQQSSHTASTPYQRVKQYSTTDQVGAAFLSRVGDECNPICHKEVHWRHSCTTTCLATPDMPSPIPKRRVVQPHRQSEDSSVAGEASGGAAMPPVPTSSAVAPPHSSANADSMDGMSALKRLVTNKKVVKNVVVLAAAASADLGEKDKIQRAGEAASAAGFQLSIEFDNKADPEATVITVSGQDQTDLLSQITGAFNSLGLLVTSANIATTDSGQVLDVFRVTDGEEGKKIAADKWDGIKAELLRMCSQTSRSSKPAIYGAAAAEEVKRLRPLKASLEGDASSLELAAAEMAIAAATLVQMEREILDLTETEEATEEALQTREAKRAEAAAALERRMAAMEAAMAARRTPIAEAKPEAARGPGADLRFQAGGATSSGPAAGDGYEILLQGFNWESWREDWYKVISDKAKKLADAGITSLWLPPPSDAVSAQGYLPRDLYNLNSKYGTEGELRECLRTLHDNGIKAVADIVVNHRCAHSQDEHGRWNKFGGRLAWDRSVICSNNPEFGGTGGGKMGEDYHAAPNIDHTQERVRQDIIKWLKWLRNSIGFDGWRFDFVKGYGGEFTKEYIDASVPELAFGEYWDTCEYTDGVLNYNQDSHRQRTVNWCDRTGGTAAAFDFTTKGILQEAMGRGEYWRLVDSQGRPPGLLGMWPSRAITFIENHDTGSTLNHWPFPHNHLHEGYAYIMTHPGSPCIFWDHFWAEGLGTSIRELIKVRKQHGLQCRSKVTVQTATADVYAAVIDSKIAMKVGYGSWSPDQSNMQIGQKGWKLNCSGPQFAVWDAEF